MFKVISPPNQRALGYFGSMPNPPKITLKTNQGLIDLNKFNARHNFGEFFSTAYFNSEVLAKYETDQRYFIDYMGSSKLDHGYLVDTDCMVKFGFGWANI